MATTTPSYYTSYTTPSLRHLTHTETLPYHPSTVFAACSDISKYASFLPLIHSSNVTSKDFHHLPKTAKLKIGYPPLGIEEEWLCLVSCDHSTGTVLVKNKDVEDATGIFDSWLMRWSIQPPPTAGARASKTAKATLELEVKFRSMVYDQMFALLQDRVAGKMIEKFVVRIAELDEVERKGRLEKIREKARLEAVRKKAAAAAKGAEPPVKAAPKKLEIRSGGK